MYMHIHFVDNVCVYTGEQNNGFAAGTLYVTRW